MSDRIHVPTTTPVIEPDQQVRVRATVRLRWVGASLLLLLGGVGIRGVQLTISPSERTLRAAAVQRWDTVTLRARRGEVLDRNGHRLATTVAAPTVVVDPSLVPPEDARDLAQDLARVVGVEVERIREVLAKRTRYQRIAVRVHPAVASAVEALGHRAVTIESNDHRYYPEATLAAHVLGFVNHEGSGRGGLEASLDRYLRGQVTLVQRRRDRRGVTVDDPTRVPDPQGMTVHLTLDRTIQRIVEEALVEVVRTSAPQAVMAVVVDVPTGDVLAMANLPTYNPNALDHDSGPRRNRAVQDEIEPGSVFKPFLVAAALEEGLVTPQTPIDCEGGAWRIGGAVIHDDHPAAIQSVSDVLVHSSNIGSAKIALDLGPQTLMSYLRGFGFGARTEVPLPGERAGLLRDPETIRPIELATTSYGQGVTSTTLQLAMATATLANGGTRMKPRLVRRVEDAFGVPDVVNNPRALGRVVSEETARAVLKMMEGVTAPDGPAPQGAIAGIRVAGKTGTAQKPEAGGYGSGRIASFVAAIPAEQPRLAIVVSIDDPSRGSHYGGLIAAPVVARIGAAALRYLGTEAPPTWMQGPVPSDMPPPTPIAVLSGGEMRWPMPDLSGHLLRDSLRTLGPAGFDIAIRGSGRVVAQSPLPGAFVAPGGAVSLTLR